MTLRRAPVAAPPDLCLAFKRRARQTWALLGRARRQSLHIKEETLTDLHLLEFMEARNPSFIIHSFNRLEEREEGSDWEWWFGQAGRWAGVRIQAKVLKHTTGEFEHLHYRPKGSKLSQCEILLQRSLLGLSPRRLPLYCLYLHHDALYFGRRDELTGCSILSPRHVLRLAPAGKRDLVTVLPLSFPWHWMVCPCLPNYSSLPDRVSAVVKNLFFAGPHPGLQGAPEAGAGWSYEMDQAIRNFEPTQTVPDYVRQIRDGGAPVIEDETLGAVTVCEQSVGEGTDEGDETPT